MSQEEISISTEVESVQVEKKLTTLNNSVVQGAKLPDYATVELKLGQYWARGNQPIAFIVELNRYGVISQSRIEVEGDDVVFDFAGGQDLYSVDAFRAMLKERQAVVVTPDDDTVALALNQYKVELKQNNVFEPKVLPLTEDEYTDLLEFERYTKKLRIAPPPRRHRHRRGLHWLKAGVSDMGVIKMWDPEADNYVLQNGLVDQSAQLGFIKGYNSLITFLSDDVGEETYDQLVTRMIDLLRKKNYYFDESAMKRNLMKFKPKFYHAENEDGIVPMSTIKHKGELPDSKDKEIMFPLYELKIGMRYVVEDMTDNKKPPVEALNLFLFENDRLVQTLEFSQIENGEFIHTKHAPTLQTQL